MDKKNKIKQEIRTAYNNSSLDEIFTIIDKYFFSEIQEKDINIPFDEFWNLYNKKVGNKDKCKKKWAKLKDNERSKIIETLATWKKQFSEKQFQPYPETYLNNKRWEDEEIIIKGERIVKQLSI